MLKQMKLGWHAGYSYYLFAIILILLVCRTSWPGFMSFDSLDALNEARSGVHWNIACPTVLIWVQGLCDRLCPGASLLFLLQVGVTFLALADIFFVADIPLLLGLPSMFFFVCCPAILGPMLVVWKDVGMMAFFLAATASLFRAQKAVNGKSFWSGSAIFWTVLGCGFRLNAIFPAVPIFFAVCALNNANRPKRSLIHLSILLLATSLILWRIDSITPEASKLVPSGGATLPPFDLIGISALSGENMLPKEMYAYYDNFTIADVRKNYFPDNVNNAFIQRSPDQKTLIFEREIPNMTRLWLKAIIKHPREYISHRINAFSVLLGLNMREPFYLTHPQIDANEFGITFKPSELTPHVLAYLTTASHTIFAFPWFYYSICVSLLLLSIAFPICRTGGVRTLLFSALCNMLSLFFLAPAASLRYSLWAIAAILIAIVLVMKNLFVAAASMRNRLSSP